MLALALAISCGRSAERGEPPLVVIGVDGFEWEVIVPLLADGRMPHLAALMERGSYGLLETLEPTLSPVVWTSIATGKTPDQHGITHFVRDLASLELLTNADRRTKALWNVASEHGLVVGVIGWWLTYPVEPVNGLMVAQTNTLERPGEAAPSRVWKGTLVPGLSHQVHPPEREPEILARLAENAARLVELEREIFRVDSSALPPFEASLWESCRFAFRADATYADVAERELSSGASYDLFMVYLGGPDVVGHRFWRYLRPELFEDRPERELAERLGAAVQDDYVYIDRVIGRLVELAGPLARIFVVSDHGMHAIHTQARFGLDAEGEEVNSGAHPDAPAGVIVAAGPGIRRAQSRRRVSELTRAELRPLAHVLDLAPTLAYLAGVPVARDWRGSVAEAILEPGVLAARPVRMVETFEDPEWQRRHRELGMRALADPERVEQLRRLGYFDGGAGR